MDPVSTVTLEAMVHELGCNLVWDISHEVQITRGVGAIGQQLDSCSSYENRARGIL